MRVSPDVGRFIDTIKERPNKVGARGGDTLSNQTDTILIIPPSPTHTTVSACRV